MATNWLDVWQSLSRRELFQKTGLATGVMLVLGALFDKASAQPSPPMQATPPGLAGPVDYFLKIDGIEGESFDIKHRGEIDVMSFSWSVSNKGPVAVGGTPPPGVLSVRPQVQGMKFVMRANKASPKLMVACAAHLTLTGAILTARAVVGKLQQEYLKWTLTDVLVSSYETGGSQGAIPADQFTLEFNRIDVEYKEQKAGFDLKAGKFY